MRRGGYGKTRTFTLHSKFIEVSRKVSQSFASHYVKVVCSTDIYGVEYSAAIRMFML